MFHRSFLSFTFASTFFRGYLTSRSFLLRTLYRILISHSTFSTFISFFPNYYSYLLIYSRSFCHYSFELFFVTSAITYSSLLLLPLVCCFLLNYFCFAGYIAVFRICCTLLFAPLVQALLVPVGLIALSSLITFTSISCVSPIGSYRPALLLPLSYVSLSSYFIYCSLALFVFLFRIRFFLPPFCSILFCICLFCLSLRLSYPSRVTSLTYIVLCPFFTPFAY